MPRVGATLLPRPSLAGALDLRCPSALVRRPSGRLPPLPELLPRPAAPRGADATSERLKRIVRSRCIVLRKALLRRSIWLGPLALASL